MKYGERLIQRDLDFEVRRGSRFMVMGGSGCGKSTLLKHMIGLLRPASGRVIFDGRDLWALDDHQRIELAQRFGVLYQTGALWSSMTLAENVALPLEQHTERPAREIAELVKLKLALVGLDGFGELYPSELSGGMRKRAGLARAMALEPEILFLDEPSAGLDPITSADLDETILRLSRTLGVTFVIVTHELASIFAIATRVIMLDREKKGILATGTPQELRDRPPHEFVRRFFHREGGSAEVHR